MRCSSIIELRELRPTLRRIPNDSAVGGGDGGLTFVGREVCRQGGYSSASPFLRVLRSRHLHIRVRHMRSQLRAPPQQTSSGWLTAVSRAEHSNEFFCA
jgi:hypothetical protein